MKRFYAAVLTAFAALAAVNAPAHATPRSPQITFASADLQNRLNLMGESINVLTQQQDGLVWGTTVSGNSVLTIQFDLVHGNTGDAELGIAKLDPTAVLRGTLTYSGVNSALFAYYIKSSGNTYFSHDGFNGDGKAHALAYAGTGQNTGCWWQCWEESPIANYLDADFNDAVVFMESMNPTPVSKSTWGQVKARFR